MTDHEIILAIQEIMDGAPWSADTTSAIADLLTENGYLLRDLDDDDVTPLRPYRVTLHEDAGDKLTLIFGCFAADEDHAEEQARDAYPSYEVVHITLATEAEAHL